MARPPLSDSRKSETPLRIRLTESERQLIDAAAQSAEETTSAWARELLLKAAAKALKK